MNKEVLTHIDRTIKSELGITYDEFNKLSFDEQQRLIEKNRAKKRKNRGRHVKVMIGSGEHVMFIRKKRGERYMLSDGSFVLAGDNPEESRLRLEGRLDNLIYSKPVTFIKRLSRRIKNRHSHIERK